MSVILHPSGCLCCMYPKQLKMRSQKDICIHPPIHPTVGRSQEQEAHRQRQYEHAYQHTVAEKGTKYQLLSLYESKENHTTKMKNHQSTRSALDYSE